MTPIRRRRPPEPAVQCQLQDSARTAHQEAYWGSVRKRESTRNVVINGQLLNASVSNQDILQLVSHAGLTRLNLEVVCAGSSHQTMKVLNGSIAQTSSDLCAPGYGPHYARSAACAASCKTSANLAASHHTSGDLFPLIDGEFPLSQLPDKRPARSATRRKPCFGIHELYVEA